MTATVAAEDRLLRAPVGAAVLRLGLPRFGLRKLALLLFAQCERGLAG